MFLFSVESLNTNSQYSQASICCTPTASENPEPQTIIATIAWGLPFSTYAPRGRGGGSSLLYISFAYYMQKKKKKGGGGPDSM